VAELDGLPVGAQLAESDADHVGGAPELRTTEEDPFHLCLRAEMIAILDEEIATLDHQARQAVALYYLEERTMKEVGIVLNICESRVSQIVTAATTQLRTCLRTRLNRKQN
jgi:RNA polymerase sigma factor (sigma-70 family)